MCGIGWGGEEAAAWPRGRTWDTETAGRLPEVPSSFNEPRHLFPPSTPPAFSSGQVQPAQGSGAVHLEMLILLSPQALQPPPKVWGHLGPRGKQFSKSLFGSLGEVEIAGHWALFKGDPAAPRHRVIALSAGGHHIVPWGQQAPVIPAPC